MERVRKCWNSKSRTHPDVVCPRPALYGDYCSYHYKNPRCFVIDTSMISIRRRHKARLVRFVKLCRVRMGLRRARRQGLVALNPSLATNETELITMDAVATIPLPYRFSFVEDGKGWLFDVRALLVVDRRNPYTSRPFCSDVLSSLETYVAWLRRRGYVLTFIEEGGGAPEPLQQRITELCLLIDSHGYLTNVSWFRNMTQEDVREAGEQLDALWMEQIGLTDAERRAIFPAWNSSQHSLVPPIHAHRALEQWTTFLLTLIRASSEKELRSLACVYTLKAMAHVCPAIQVAFSWL
jgi:hypothetical protein